MRPRCAKRPIRCAERARNGESLDDLLAEAFALTREASRRAIGQRHYDVQLIGGMVLHDGAIAEMRTGEGKTLTATLAVFLNTLAGDSVHLVTVNDYLARRDAEWMKPIYDSLGVSVAAIQEGDDHATRQQKYACDVTYGTNSEFGFDYLRDNMASALEHCVQRGHHFAIVDEVDNILIDEARTPLIISGAARTGGADLLHFARLAKQTEGRAGQREAQIARRDARTPPRSTTTTSSTRSTRRWRRPSAASKGTEEFVGVENLYARPARAASSTTLSSR